MVTANRKRNIRGIAKKAALGVALTGALAASMIGARAGAEKAGKWMADRHYRVRLEKIEYEQKLMQEFEEKKLWRIVEDEATQLFFKRLRSTTNLEKKLMENTISLGKAWDKYQSAKSNGNKRATEEAESMITRYIFHINSIYTQNKELLDSEYLKAKKNFEIKPNEIAMVAGTWALLIPPAAALAYLLIRSRKRNKIVFLPSSDRYSQN